MGWGTYLVTPMYFSKETYKTKYEVEKALNEVKETISHCKARLKNFAIMTEPQKFCPEDMDPMSWIESEVEEILEALEWAYTDDYKLTMLLDRWDDCHDKNGNAIIPPKPYKLWRMNFCGGDFIKEVYPDGTEVTDNDDDDEV